MFKLLAFSGLVASAAAFGTDCSHCDDWSACWDASDSCGTVAECVQNAGDDADIVSECLPLGASDTGAETFYFEVMACYSDCEGDDVSDTFPYVFNVDVSTNGWFPLNVATFGSDDTCTNIDEDWGWCRVEQDDDGTWEFMAIYADAADNIYTAQCTDDTCGDCGDVWNSYTASSGNYANTCFCEEEDGEWTCYGSEPAN